MANAIEQLNSGLVVGHAMLGRRGQQPGSVAQQVHDGDTVTAAAAGNLGVRFLGVDATEVSVALPGTRLPFIDLDDERWERVLADPFSPALDPFDPPLDGALQQQLQGRVGPGTAANHARLADKATKALEGIVGQDMQDLARPRRTSSSSWPSPARSWTATGGCWPTCTPTRPTCQPNSGSCPTTSGCWRRAG